MSFGSALYRLSVAVLREATSELLNTSLYLRHRQRLNITVSLLALFLLSQRAIADEPVPLTVTATAEVRMEEPQPDGTLHWRFLPAGQLHQGDEVFFTLAVRNATPVVAPDVTVTWPVPANTVYVPESASGPAAQIDYSVDGGRTFDRAGRLRVIDGSGGTRAATERDYTHLRWRLRYPLAPNAVALLRFRTVFQ